MKLWRLAVRVAWLVATIALYFGPGVADAQQLGAGMDRTGTVGIQNETERKLFSSLICTCGCPREALSTCTCGFAHTRRAELRAELDAGKSIDTIVADYAARFGSQALAVPPNTGSHRFVWLLPVTAIVVGAGFVVFTLRRWRSRTQGSVKTTTGKPVQATQPRGDDAYEQKLDDELQDLDRE